MKRASLIVWLLSVLSAVLLSLPWLVPGAGFVALFAFLPLLLADALAQECRMRRFWLCALSCFVIWNTATTFWVCNATVGGGIFAILANSAQMLLVWLIFTLSKRKLGSGVLPYIFLAAMWVAWERRYFFVDISWPWLTLGNAFARSTRLVQWYEYTGTIGGSLWIWICNLSIFGLLTSVGSGAWKSWNVKARACAVAGLALAFAAPVAASLAIYSSYEEKSEGNIDVLVAQPNFDPYQKFESLSQMEQTEILLSQLDPVQRGPVLMMAPETFTGSVFLHDINSNPSVRAIQDMLERHPGSAMLFGASTYDIYSQRSAPSLLARQYGDGWIESHNSALVTDGERRNEVYHKSKLVVGTELTPYPKIFVPLDNWLSKLFGVYGLMAREVGQDEVSLLHYNGVPFGCAVCYESIYGEYCTDYVKKGAKFLAVITNDAWWGNTPGYRQHCSYSSLRAIELRRDVARCGNTGISCFIDQKGDVVSQSEWWQRQTLAGSVNLNSEETFFVRNGDIAGRVCTLVFLLVLMLLVARMFKPGR